MRFNNQTKLVLTIFCMFFCLAAMFLGIFVGAKQLNFTEWGEITFNNVDVKLESFVTGHDRSDKEDGLTYDYKRSIIVKGMQEGVHPIGFGELKWKKTVTQDTLKVENITMVIAVTNTATDGSFLCVTLAELSNSLTDKNSIYRTFYSGVGVMTEDEDVFLTNGNTVYKGIQLDEGAPGIKTGSGIPAGYTYVVKIVYSLQNLNKNFKYENNKFDMSLTSQISSDFGTVVEPESEPATN